MSGEITALLAQIFYAKSNDTKDALTGICCLSNKRFFTGFDKE